MVGHEDRAFADLKIRALETQALFFSCEGQDEYNRIRWSFMNHLVFGAMILNLSALRAVKNKFFCLVSLVVYDVLL